MRIDPRSVAWIRGGSLLAVKSKDGWLLLTPEDDEADAARRTVLALDELTRDGRFEFSVAEILRAGADPRILLQLADVFPAAVALSTHERKVLEEAASRLDEG